MSPSPWPKIPPITASDLKTYVNENRDDALALLQSAAASAGKGPMVEMPRGSLLIFLTNIIGMCNITPFQAADQDKLEKLDSVNAKLTTFHNFIRESRITCRMCGQCSDKQNTSAGVKSGQMGQVRRVDDGSMLGTRDKRRDVKDKMHVDRIRSVHTADRLHQDHVASHEQDRQLGTLRDPLNRDSGTRRERQTEHGNQTDDAALIGEADAPTAPNFDGAQFQKRPLEITVPTGRQEGHGQDGGQARPQLYKQLDNQIATNPYEGEDEGYLVSHTVQEDTSGFINPDTEEQAIQARRDAVEDRIPASQQEAQTQYLNFNQIVTPELMEALMRDEEEAILFEPATQVEKFMIEGNQANTNMKGSGHVDATEGPVQDGYGTERLGSQGDDELSADDIDADKESLSPEDIIQQSDSHRQRCDAVENDEILDTSGRTASESESESTEENKETEPTPGTSMSDTLDVWREGLAESGPPENLKNTGSARPGIAEAAQVLPSQAGTTRCRRNPRRSCEVRVKILNDEIASEVKLLTDIKLKQCLEREIKSTKAWKAQIDSCKLLPSGEIRIWTSDNRGAQLLRQVYGWMPGAFGGLQIQRKNSTVVVPKI